MNTIRILGTGRVRALPAPKSLDSATALCLERPSGHRLTLATVPVGQHVILVAVIASGAVDLGAEPHCRSAEGTGFALGSGVVWANQPAPGIGPADQIGFTANPNTSAWQTALLEQLTGQTVQLEAHPPRCGCSSIVPAIPKPRTASGQEAVR